jgi:hypothetical protein
MSEKTYVCGYRHCLHKGEKVKQEEAVTVGTRRYHADCAAIHRKIEQMKDLYYEKIDENAEFVQLTSVLNNIVFTKKINPDYMLFALNYIVKKKVKINSPYALHYLPKNKLIFKLWNEGEDKFDNRQRTD